MAVVTDEHDAVASGNTEHRHEPDEGPGLPAGALELVFDKFYRGRSSPQGFGLGLSIARAVATAHGGRISARNRSPKGTTFRFELPLEEPPLPPKDDHERA